MKIKIILSLLILSQNNFELGKSYLEEKKIKMSIEFLSKSIENNVKLDSSYMYRGEAKIEIRDFDGALKDLNTSLKINPLNQKIYFYIGKVCVRKNNYTKAIEFLSKAIELDSNDVNSFDRAIAKLFKRDLQGALKDINTAIALDSLQARFYNNRGFIKYNLSKFDESIKDFNIVIKIDSNDLPRAYTNIGLSLVALNKNSEAIKYFSLAILRMPEMADIWYYRGNAYKAIGDLKNACINFEKSNKLGYSKARIDYIVNCKYQDE